MTVRAGAAILALLCLATAAGAAEVGDLYRGQAIVTGTAEPERTRGFRLALIDVLVKRTGDARLEARPDVAALVAAPHPFVEGFEYEDRMKDIPVHDEQGTRERPHVLRVEFKAGAVDAALDRLGLVPWPADRPLVAVWLGVETARGRFVLTAAGSDGYGQRAALVETAARRGVPIRLPPQGQTAIAFADVARAEVAKLQSASPDADALLLGTLSLGPGGTWTVRWRLHHGESIRAWRLEGVSFDDALRNGIETAALVFSGRV